MKSSAVALLGLAAASALAACDRFESKQDAAGAKEPRDPRGAVQAELTRAMKAVQALTSSCKAGDLSWEEEATEEAGPKHYSRPCIPERCDVAAADLEALRSAVADAKRRVADDATLRVPSIEGFVSLAEATLAFVDTSRAAAKADPRGSPAALSGLSLHYGAMASAFAKLYDEPKLPAEPPSLTASLAEPGVGGDVCKGWSNPKYCDVKAIEVPPVRRWRASPACIEVDAVAKK